MHLTRMIGFIAADVITGNVITDDIICVLMFFKLRHAELRHDLKIDE